MERRSASCRDSSSSSSADFSVGVPLTAEGAPMAEALTAAAVARADSAAVRAERAALVLGREGSSC